MKKYIIIAIIVILLGTGVYFAGKKVSGATKLDFDIEGIDIPVNSLGEFISFLTSGINADVNIILMNYSNEEFKIDNINVYLKNLDQSVTIAYQTAPLSQPIIIAPNSNTTVSIPFYFKGAMIFQILKQLGINASNVTEAWNVFKTYITTGKFGTSIIVDGYAVKGSLKLKFNFEKGI